MNVAKTMLEFYDWWTPASNLFMICTNYSMEAQKNRHSCTCKILDNDYITPTPPTQINGNYIGMNIIAFYILPGCTDASIVTATVIFNF